MLKRQVSGLGSSQGSWSGAGGSVWASFTVGCCEADEACWAERSSSCQGLWWNRAPENFVLAVVPLPLG